MPIIHCDGVHATCMIYASAIKENGFKLSPDDRYLGAGVYFYDKNKNGDTFANIHRKNKLKNKHCPEKDNVRQGGVKTFEGATERRFHLCL